MSRKTLKIIAGAPDHPINISGIEIACYVLEGEVRVLSQGGFLQAIGRARTPRAGTGGVDNIPAFLGPKNLEPFVSNGNYILDRTAVNPHILDRTRV